MAHRWKYELLASPTSQPKRCSRDRDPKRLAHSLTSASHRTANSCHIKQGAPHEARSLLHSQSLAPNPMSAWKWCICDAREYILFLNRQLTHRRKQCHYSKLSRERGNWPNLLESERPPSSEILALVEESEEFQCNPARSLFDYHISSGDGSFLTSKRVSSFITRLVWAADNVATWLRIVILVQFCGRINLTIEGSHLV